MKARLAYYRKAVVSGAGTVLVVAVAVQPFVHGRAALVVAAVIAGLTTLGVGLAPRNLTKIELRKAQRELPRP